MYNSMTKLLRCDRWFSGNGTLGLFLTSATPHRNPRVLLAKSTHQYSCAGIDQSKVQFLYAMMTPFELIPSVSSRSARIAIQSKHAAKTVWPGLE